MWDRQKLLVIVGSGVSQSCDFPSTDELTRDITRTGCTYVKTIVQYRSVPGPDPEQGLLNTENWPMTAVLWDAIRGSYTNPNFETYIHALETLEPFAGARRVSGPPGLDAYKPVLSAFTEVLGRYEPFMRSQIIQRERLDVTRRICQCLGDSMRAVEQYPNRASAKASLSRLFAGIRDRFSFDVLTLNYDELIDEIIPEYVDGFRSNDADGAGTFDPRVFLSGDKSAALFLHLHGSVRFGYRRDDGKIASEIVKYKSSKLAMESLQEAMQSLDTIGADSAYGGLLYSVVPIVSGFQKADKLMLAPSPFGYYYHAAVGRMLQQNRVLVLGYGSADPHVNTWLIEAARVHGDQYRLVYVSKDHPQPGSPTPASRFLSKIEPSCVEVGFPASDALRRFGSRIITVNSGLPLADSVQDEIFNFLSES